MAGTSAEAILSQIDAAWRPFDAEVTRLGEARIDQATAAGWSAKELLAHIAFWDEAVEGAVINLFRRGELPAGWAFGSGYIPDPADWPKDHVHNAREAEWARGQTAACVLARMQSAHDALLRFVPTVSDQEATANADYFARLGEHYREHLADLKPLQ